VRYPYARGVGRQAGPAWPGAVRSRVAQSAERPAVNR
jgi:hypothetical protein